MIRTKDNYIGRKLRITNPVTTEGEYANILPGTHHRIIKKPGITPNSKVGVWVYGVNEPVYILSKEFVFLDAEIPEFKRNPKK